MGVNADLESFTLLMLIALLEELNSRFSISASPNFRDFCFAHLIFILRKNIFF